MLCTKFYAKGRFFMRFHVIVFVGLILSAVGLSACSTNPATGRSQFTGLMSPSAEQSIGAEEHQKIIKQMGLYQNDAVQNYVRGVGQKIAANTERADVTYQFFVVDDDMVNAFALPGGYVYVTRGLLALVNSEAQLAAVIGHEIAHVTGRHSAERYSRGVVTGLGVSILGAALENSAASQVLNTGADLWTRSYSRGQESEADVLGIRYLHQAGYDPFAMAEFLTSMGRHSELISQLSGKPETPAFFSTHPNTGNRVVLATQTAGTYASQPNVRIGRETYLRVIDGIAYGSGSKEGVIKGQSFLHPQIGFKFTAPKGFELINKTNEVIARGPDGAVIVFDFNKVQQALSPAAYMANIWMGGEVKGQVENITINGMRAATTAFPGNVGGAPVSIRLIAIEWADGNFARFQIAIPQSASAELVDDFKRTTYSFARLSAAEKRSIVDQSVKVITASAKDSVASLSSQLPFKDYKKERFLILNGMEANDEVKAGQRYKLIVN